jgi:hypothetical protein
MLFQFFTFDTLISTLLPHHGYFCQAVAAHVMAIISYIYIVIFQWMWGQDRYMCLSSKTTVNVEIDSSVFVIVNARNLT